jgi:hypothetical protein
MKQIPIMLGAVAICVMLHDPGVNGAWQENAVEKWEIG